ncbi:TlpA family protein disulfide reductase [Parashewanella spongiae]|nr:TlpA disulfide reductase family protein [Parashewanella spongiae]
MTTQVAATEISSQSKKFLAVGDVAPQFVIQRLNGSQFSLADYKGKKPVYLIFWNTWCGYCIKKIPKINAIARQYRQDIEILAINTSWSDNLGAISEFQTEHQTDYPMAFDDEAVITKSYHVWGAPTEFIIDINGVVVHRDNIPDAFDTHIARWQKTSCQQEVC